MRHPLVTRKKSWFYSPIVTVVLLALIGWGGVGVVKAYQKQRDAVSFRNQYARDLAELQTKQEELGVKIGDLSTERGMEAEVRNRYRVAKPGENLVIVVDNDDGVEHVERVSFWSKVRQFVGF